MGTSVEKIRSIQRTGVLSMVTSKRSLEKSKESDTSHGRWCCWSGSSSFLTFCLSCFELELSAQPCDSV